MVDELIGAELENKQAPNEGGDVEADIVVVDHVEKSVIAWSNVYSREEKSRGEKMKCLKHCPGPNEEVPQNPKGVNRLLDFQHEPREASMTQVQVYSNRVIVCP